MHIVQWTTVGQLETGRYAHAVLSIDSEALPCLQGCIGQDDLFVGSYQKNFHHHHPACLDCHIYGASIRWMIMIILSSTACKSGGGH